MSKILYRGQTFESRTHRWESEKAVGVYFLFRDLPVIFGQKLEITDRCCPSHLIRVVNYSYWMSAIVRRMPDGLIFVRSKKLMSLLLVAPDLKYCCRTLAISWILTLQRSFSLFSVRKPDWIGVTRLRSRVQKAGMLFVPFSEFDSI